MWENIDKDIHYSGVFNILGEEISGELIYNKKKGTILINVIKNIRDVSPLGRSYANINSITGKMNTGAVVSLFHNRCVKNHTQAFHTQQLNFVADYMIWSNSNTIDKKHNKMTCVLKNALRWSGLTMLDTSDHSVIKLKYNKNDNVYHWFNSKVSFSTNLNCGLFAFPIEEETKIVEHLVVEIEAEEEQDVSYFISVRNKIISLISFAIRDNVNIEEQYLQNYEDTYEIAENVTECYKDYLITSDSHLSTHRNNVWEYNFTLEKILPEKDIRDELLKLEPIFNLYLSLFKYRDMPAEMVFLNIVQALETFHARFFYDDNKEKYVTSVLDRFGNYSNFSDIEKLLLCDTQKDENCKYIILVSRLNDLLIGQYDGLFYEYYGIDSQFAQTVADTRHYYTHYGKSKEKKALKGDKLLDAIFVLTVLLEYNVCLVLGIDIRETITHRLSSHEAWKQFEKESNKK